MRGEYTILNKNHHGGLELPPRARRILIFWIPRVMWVGTTSACAENTHATPAPAPANGNYLRVRGEYTMYFCAVNATQELPPRARRIPRASHVQELTKGTTSACAENTLSIPQKHSANGNYLRVRGEYPTTSAAALKEAELPPRARRIP